MGRSERDIVSDTAAGTAAWSIINDTGTTRTFNANATLAEMGDFVALLIQDLQAAGVLGE